jgi:cytochrome P450
MDSAYSRIFDTLSPVTVGSTLFFSGAILAITWINLTPPLAWLPNVPIQESSSFLFGYTKFLQEKTTRKMLADKGPVVQFQVFGRKVLFIADKNLARAALRDITGKGYPFHNLTPKLVPFSLFSIDTGPEWTLRRSTFRKAFSTTCLKAHMATVKNMTERLVQYLEKRIEAHPNEVIRLDDVFIQLTLGVICEVAFEMNVNAFDENLSYGEKLHATMKNLGKVILYWRRYNSRCVA